jgi:GNAT superfamily N-acetyltransferase
MEGSRDIAGQGASKGSSLLRRLEMAELSAAAALLGRSMSDNPVNVRAFGIENSARRASAMTRFFLPVLKGLYRRGRIDGAFESGRLVGVCGLAAPGNCQPRAAEKLRILPHLAVGNPLGATIRVLRWVGEWARRDPNETHWHLGPVAVARDSQGKGIGSAMMARFCAEREENGVLSYLETDKSENVRFYRRFGFSVIAEGDVLGIKNWFMLRRPQSRQLE